MTKAFTQTKSKLTLAKDSLLFFILFILASLYSHPVVANPPQLNREQVNEVLYHVHTYYVEDVPLSHIKKDNFNELFDLLDPYSKYLNEYELESIFSATNGKYTGIGIEVEENEKQVTIVGVLPNSPAEIAGVEIGDIFVSVDTQNVTNKGINYISKLLKKTHLSSFDIIVQRAKKEINLTLQRKEISLDSVNSQLLSNGNGYLSISMFNNNSLRDVQQNLKLLLKQNGKALSGLILDLRDNPGGTLDSAIAISDLFLQKGTIVTTKGRYLNANQHFDANKGDILNNAPIVVLINDKSASAAEILAGALKDNKRALVIGTPSYGKGSVQSLIPLGNGKTALKLTTAKYYTPSGQSIEGVGIKPDITVTKQVLSYLDKNAIMTGEQVLDSSLFTHIDSHLLEANIRYTPD